MKACYSCWVRRRLPLLPANLTLIALVVWLAPLERTLGARIRLIYLHGAWVWAGKAARRLAPPG